MIKFKQIRKKLNEMGAGGAGVGIANVAGSGAIAGLGVGPQGEPPGPKAVLARIRRKKTECFRSISVLHSYLEIL